MFNELRDKILLHHLSGSFLLPSGKVASEYYDLHEMMTSPRELCLLRDEVAKVLSNIEFDSLGCMELCPVPLLGALLAGPLGSKRGFIVRRQPKGYGTNKCIEGCLFPGDRVALIEDVTSTGKSIKRAIDVVESHGCTVAVVVTVVNRQEGCDEPMCGYDFKYLCTREELENG